MKKTLSALIALCFLVMASNAFATVGYVANGSPKGTITDIAFQEDNGNRSFSGSRLTFNLLQTGMTGTYTSEASNDTDLSVSHGYVAKELSSDPAFQSDTLQNGTEGQLLFITIVWDDLGSGSYTLTPTTSSNFASITFDAVDERAILWYPNDTLGWFVLHTNATMTYR